MIFVMEINLDRVLRTMKRRQPAVSHPAPPRQFGAEHAGWREVIK